LPSSSSAKMGQGAHRPVPTWGAAALRYSRSAGLAVLLPPVALTLGLFVLPIAYLLFVSFMTHSQNELYLLKPSLDNYIAIATDPFYLRIIERTLIASVFVLGLCLLIGYPVAAYIAGCTPRRRLLLLLVLLFPLMVSNVIRAYGWITLLSRRGVVNSALQGAGLIERPLLMLPGLEAVVIGLMTILLPFMIISITNSLTAIDRSYAEAAQSLGAGPVRTFLHVTFPLSSPGVAGGLMTTFFLFLSAYVTVSLLGGPRSKLLVNLVYDQVISFNWPRAAALSFVMLAIALTFGALVQVVLRPGKISGKGG
jgi:putative spermidine/putrescine transport system permease protein